MTIPLRGCCLAQCLCEFLTHQQAVFRPRDILQNDPEETTIQQEGSVALAQAPPESLQHNLVLSAGPVRLPIRSCSCEQDYGCGLSIAPCTGEHVLQPVPEHTPAWQLGWAGEDGLTSRADFFQQVQPHQRVHPEAPRRACLEQAAIDQPIQLCLAGSAL